ncbi:MAG: hypothetical protein ACYDCC_02290 [Actinomycetota bacterium]
MSESKKRRNEIWTTAILLSLIAALTFLIEVPAHAADNSWYSLDVGPNPTGEPQQNTNYVQAGDVTWTVNLSTNNSSGAAASPLLILAKFEGGPNDPNATNDGVGASDYTKADGSCSMAIGDTNCTLVLHMPVVGATQNRHDYIRFWINGRRIDLAKGISDSGTGCIDAASDGTPGDATDFVDSMVIPSTASPTGGAPAPWVGPIQGELAHPPTCPSDSSVTYANDLPNTRPDGGAAASGSPSQSSSSPSPSNSGSASPSNTASASPSNTSSASASPTASSSPTDTSTPSASPSPSTPPGEIDLSPSPTSAVFGATIDVAGVVTCAGSKVANAIVDVYRRILGQSNWTKIETESDVQGRFAIRDEELYGSADYGATWDGNTVCSRTGAALKRVYISVGAIANVFKSSLPPGESANFYGKILPAHPGKKIALQLYRGDQHKWTWVAQSRLDKNSNYNLFYMDKQKGYLLFRVVYLTQDLDHQWNISRNIKVTWG